MNRSRPQIETALKNTKKKIEAAASIRENTVVKKASFEVNQSVYTA